MAMISYDTSILPLIREICTAHPRVTQPWYAEIAVVEGTLDAFQDHMRYLLVRGHQWGYLPEPTKSILIVSPRNDQRVEEHFQGMGVREVTRILYLERFINYQDSEKEWLEEKLMGWTDSVEVLYGEALQHIQIAYDSL